MYYVKVILTLLASPLFALFFLLKLIFFKPVQFIYNKIIEGKIKSNGIVANAQISDFQPFQKAASKYGSGYTAYRLTVNFLDKDGNSIKTTVKSDIDFKKLEKLKSSKIVDITYLPSNPTKILLNL